MTQETNEVQTYAVVKYKYVKEKYCFFVEASSDEEALKRAKEYQETSDDLEDVEDTSISSEYEVDTH